MKFHTRIRQQGEAVSDFIASLRKLADSCDFKTVLNDMLRDRLVCGINNDLMQTRLLEDAELTFEKAVKMFSFILLRALLPVLASSDGTTACTIWNNEDQASSYHPAISSASSRPADSSLKQLILGQVWRAPSSSTAAYPPTINQPTQPMSLCGLGGCATTQTTNPFNFFVQMFSFILLRALLPVLASSDGTTACTIWNNEDQASSYHPAISSASSRPADSSLKQLILGQVWRAPSSSTAAYPPTINQPTQPMSLCGLGGCATTQTTNPFNFFVQRGEETERRSGHVCRRAYGKDAKEKTRVVTLVRTNLPVIEHDTGIWTVDQVLIEIMSNTKRDGRSVFALNVYSSPAKRHRFAGLFRATLEITKQQALVVVGDFNAPHPDWGYLT
ncbi:uncharacterized protein ISCGN_008045 [Ixodes scapularis]